MTVEGVAISDCLLSMFTSGKGTNGQCDQVEEDVAVGYQVGGGRAGVKREWAAVGTKPIRSEIRQQHD